MIKDLKYVILSPHSLIFTIFFSFTIVLPIFITIKRTKMLRMAMRDFSGDKKQIYGKPVVINELLFVLKAINQQMGYSASLKVLDAAQWIYNSEMTVK